VFRTAPALYFVATCFLTFAISARSDSAFPVATPESQGIDSQTLNRLTEEIGWYFRQNIIVGGELLVIKNRRTILHEVIGWKDKEAREHIERNTIFNVRSMSKPLTGTAIQILIDEGRLRLDDRAADYIPGFDNDASRSITVEQLLTHRSGLPLTILWTMQDFQSHPDLLSIANETGRQGPEFTPGDKFWYSDAGSEVLGAIVEVISGQRLDEFITERLLEPIGMNSSFSYAPRSGDEDLWERVASLYVGQIGSWTRFWTPDDAPFYHFALGSQSLYSTPMDYARFLAMWMDKGIIQNGQRLLSEEAVTRVLTPVSEMMSLGSDTRGTTGFPSMHLYYGQMAVLYATDESLANREAVVIGHSGSDGTWAWAWPDLDLMVLFFTQSRGQASGMTLETRIDQALVGELIPRDVPDEYRPYVGTYTIDGSNQNGEYDVIVQNGRLSMVFPGQISAELKEPDDRDRWRLVLTNQVYVVFDEDGTGTVTGLRLYEPGHQTRLHRVRNTPVESWRFH